MKIEEVKKLSPLDRFIYWVRERHNIFLRRRSGMPNPWTDDEILRSYRFCNVRRMNDKVSIWLLENWYKPYFNHPNMLYAVALARFLNLPQTLAEVGFPEVWNETAIKKALYARKSRGDVTFNGAYIVRGGDGKDKIDGVVSYFVRPLVDDPPVINTNSMEETWGALRNRYGFGSFTAGQVVADLRWAMKGSWTDKMNWAPAGPGSIRGMNRLQSRPIGQVLTQDQFLSELRCLMGTVIKKLPQVTSTLECHDYQNCLCEFDKYERVLHTDRKLRTFKGTP